MSEDETTAPQREGWHLDRRVPISIIGAIVIQTILVTWHMADVQAQVADHERRMTAQERSTEGRISRDMAQEGRLSRIEEGIRALLETAQRLERRVERQQP